MRSTGFEATIYLLAGAPPNAGAFSSAVGILPHRFFAEDIPFGLVPMVDLAELAGVDVPVMQEALAKFQGVGDWFAGARRIRPGHLDDLAP